MQYPDDLLLTRYEPLLRLIIQLEIQAECQPVYRNRRDWFHVTLTRPHRKKLFIKGFGFQPSSSASAPCVLTILCRVLREARLLEEHPTLAQWELRWDFNTDDPLLYAECEQAYRACVERNICLKAFLGADYQRFLDALPQ